MDQLGVPRYLKRSSLWLVTQLTICQSPLAILTIQSALFQRSITVALLENLFMTLAKGLEGPFSKRR